MRPSRIELEIGELVLHGFAPGDRHRIAEAMERELSRLLADGGVPSSLSRAGSIEQLDGGAFQAEPGTKPEVTGARIAHAIFGEFTR